MLEDDIQKLEEILSKFEQDKLGLPSHGNDFKAPEVLSAPLDDLRRKTPEDLAECGLELSRYALYIERAIGKLKAQERWAKSKLDDATADYLDKVPTGYGWNERMLIAKTKPEYCQNLNRFIREVEMKLSRLYNIPKHIEIIAKCIDNLRFVAIKREKSD